MADHLVAKNLLDMHLVVETPESAFAAGGPLAFLSDRTQHISPGLLEAMCVQVVERTGKELISLAPGVLEQWGIGQAFFRSLVWRASTAFPSNTLNLLKRLVCQRDEAREFLNVLLTLCTIPGHPLNGDFLDARLREYSMPNRDAWWSVFLHESWRELGAVHRVVDWAWSVSPGTALEDEAVDLCAVVLSWTLTTSNRFLRDRATKSLVNLLTGRPGAVVRLIERFADVDDPYVLERVYAVAYGTSMRCQDLAEVGALAQCVYSRVFAATPRHTFYCVIMPVVSSSARSILVRISKSCRSASARPTAASGRASRRRRRASHIWPTGRVVHTIAETPNGHATESAGQ